MGVERDHGNRHAPESISSDGSVPRPQDVLCAHCKTRTRPGFLCKTCSRFVPFPVEKVKTPGYNQLPEGY